MQVNFNELKSLYKSLFVNVDDLVMDEKEASVEAKRNSGAAYDRLELIAKLAVDLSIFRPMPFDRN